MTAGRWRLDSVAETFQREYEGDLVSIEAAGESIESTARHPFRVTTGEDLDQRPITEELGDDNHVATTAGRWVEAQHLRPGDTLLTRESGLVEVEAVTTRHATLPVYNLQIEACRTYSVGAAGVLVHNVSPDCHILRAQIAGLTETGRAKRVLKGQQAPGPEMRLSPPEMAFRDGLLDRKPNLMVYRTKDGDGLGDFIIVDPSNPRHPSAIAVEAKTRFNEPFAGESLRDATEFMQNAGFTNTDRFTGNLDELLDFLGAS